jgi:hypothetical protein
MRGAQSFVQRFGPLIVFEFHAETRRRFSLTAVQAVLGPDYEIYHLRADGWLDTHLQDTWNCVAVNSQSSWLEVCRQRLR